MTRRQNADRLLAVLGNPTCAQSFTDRQWSDLVADARSANVLGALSELLARAHVKPGLQAARHLDGARQLSGRQRQSVIWEVHRLQSVLGKLRVPILLLKGAAYVMAREDVAQGRLFGDIDILVPSESIEAVERELTINGWVSAKSSAYDQRYYRQWMHEIPPMTHLRRGTVLDVHHTILPLTSRHAPDPTRIIARSRPLDTFGIDAIRVPCREDMVIHSITHLVHEGELHNGLRDLRDIDCMLRDFSKQDGFWGRLGPFAAQNDLAQPVVLGLQLARRVFGTPIPEAVFASLCGQPDAHRPAPWLIWLYSLALRSGRQDADDPIVQVARWLIYVRAHALRMPLPQLARHLATKAWMRWRDSLKDSNPA